MISYIFNEHFASLAIAALKYYRSKKNDNFQGMRDKKAHDALLIFDLFLVQFLPSAITAGINVNRCLKLMPYISSCGIALLNNSAHK